MISCPGSPEQNKDGFVRSTRYSLAIKFNVGGRQSSYAPQTKPKTPDLPARRKAVALCQLVPSMRRIVGKLSTLVCTMTC